MTLRVWVFVEKPPVGLVLDEGLRQLRKSRKKHQCWLPGEHMELQSACRGSRDDAHQKSARDSAHLGFYPIGFSWEFTEDLEMLGLG